MEVNDVVNILSVLLISYLVSKKLLNINDEEGGINISALFVAIICMIFYTFIYL